MKKTLKISGIVILVLVLTLISLPYLFKNKIVAKIKEEANKNLTAKLDFSDFDLTLDYQFSGF